MSRETSCALGVMLDITGKFMWEKYGNYNENINFGNIPEEKHKHIA